MQFSSKSARRAPLFVVLALAALLLVPVSANAAMGGANAGTTTLRPDLRTVTVTGVDTTNVTITVTYCFNKPIGSTPTAGGFRLGTYRNTVQPERTADSASRNGTSCVDAVFSAAPLDVQEFTYGTVSNNSVVTSSQGNGNLPDSSALILPAGIGTNTGTTNHHSGPTLTGIVPNNGTSTVVYTFDKRLSFAGVFANAFYMEDVNGNVIGCTCAAATDVTFSGNTVTVKFPTGSLGTTVRGVVSPGAVRSLAEIHTQAGGSPNLTVQSAARPGSSGNTNLPDYISSVIAADGSFIDYTFDETINTINTPGGFHALSSDNEVFTPAGAAELQIINNNTVRWTPADQRFKAINEYMVQAAVDRGSVTATAAPAGRTSSEGHAPLGDNAGAFAAGFTTGAEALRTTIVPANKTITLLLDQRIATANNTGFILIDDTGAQLSATPISVSGTGGPASQVTITLSYTADISGARSVLLCNAKDCGVTATLTSKNDVGGGTARNVTQIISPTPAARLVRKHGRVVRHRGTMVRTKHRRK